jgi:hypothetical protein
MIVLREGDTPARYAERQEELYVKLTSQDYFDIYVEPWFLEHTESREIPETNGRRWWYTAKERTAS